MRLFDEPLTAEQKDGFNRLADDIECGAKLHPQGFGALIEYVDEDEQTGGLCTCALGAALVCQLTRIRTFESDDQLLRERRIIGDYTDILRPYGLDKLIVDKGLINVPDEGIWTGKRPAMWRGLDMGGVIYRINDRWKWSRERIAAFLRTLE